MSRKGKRVYYVYARIEFSEREGEVATTKQEVPSDTQVGPKAAKPRKTRKFYQILRRLEREEQQAFHEEADQRDADAKRLVRLGWA